MSRTAMLAAMLMSACTQYTEAPPAEDDQTMRSFDTEEVSVVLEVANTASFDVLYQELDLAACVAEGIVEGRPFESLDALRSVTDLSRHDVETLLAYGYAQAESTVAFDCAAHAVIDGDGWGYSDLGTAILRTHSDTVYLCDGTHSSVAFEADITNMTFVGIGEDVSIRVDQTHPAVPLELGADLNVPSTLSFHNVRFYSDSVVELRLTGWNDDRWTQSYHGVTFDHVVVDTNRLVATFESCTFANAPLAVRGGRVTFIDTLFRHPELMPSLASSTAAVYVGPSFAAYSEPSTGVVDFIGGAFHHNYDALSVSDDLVDVRIEGVDFGWQDTENYRDVIQALTYWMDLREDSWGACHYRCSFE